MTSSASRTKGAPDEKLWEAYLAFLKQLHDSLKPCLSLPEPIRTPEREVGECLIFSVMPCEQADVTEAVNDPDFSEMATYGNSADKFAFLVVSSKNMGTVAKTFLPRSAFGSWKLPALHHLIRAIFSAAARDYTELKRPGTSPIHTQPNSLAFTDITIWRCVKEAFNRISNASLAHIGIPLRTYDVGTLMIQMPEDKDGTYKSARKMVLVMCAEASCSVLGTHKYRCSRCGVAYYCKPAHQVKDWKALHKFECSELVKSQKEDVELSHEVLCGCRDGCSYSTDGTTGISSKVEHLDKPLKERAMVLVKPMK